MQINNLDELIILETIASNENSIEKIKEISEKYDSLDEELKNIILNEGKNNYKLIKFLTDQNTYVNLTIDELREVISILKECSFNDNLLDIVNNKNILNIYKDSITKVLILVRNCNYNKDVVSYVLNPKVIDRYYLDEIEDIMKKFKEYNYDKKIFKFINSVDIVIRFNSNEIIKFMDKFNFYNSEIPINFVMRNYSIKKLPIDKIFKILEKFNENNFDEKEIDITTFIIKTSNYSINNILEIIDELRHCDYSSFVTSFITEKTLSNFDYKELIEIMKCLNKNNSEYASAFASGEAMLNKDALFITDIIDYVQCLDIDNVDKDDIYNFISNKSFLNNYGFNEIKTIIEEMLKYDFEKLNSILSNSFKYLKLNLEDLKILIEEIKKCEYNSEIKSFICDYHFTESHNSKDIISYIKLANENNFDSKIITLIKRYSENLDYTETVKRINYFKENKNVLSLGEDRLFLSKDLAAKFDFDEIKELCSLEKEYFKNDTVKFYSSPITLNLGTRYNLDEIARIMEFLKENNYSPKIQTILYKKQLIEKLSSDELISFAKDYNDGKIKIDLTKEEIEKYFETKDSSEKVNHNNIKSIDDLWLIKSNLQLKKELQRLIEEQNKNVDSKKLKIEKTNK